MEFLNVNVPMPNGQDGNPIAVYPWMAVRADSVKCNSFTELNNKGSIKYVSTNSDAHITYIISGMPSAIDVTPEVRVDHSEGAGGENQDLHHPFSIHPDGGGFAVMVCDYNSMQGKNWNLKATVLGSLKNTVVDPAANSVKLAFQVCSDTQWQVHTRTIECDEVTWYAGQDSYLFQGKATIPFLLADKPTGFGLCRPALELQAHPSQGVPHHAYQINNISIEYAIEKIA